jgi:hypothetical protein
MMPALVEAQRQPGKCLSPAQRLHVLAFMLASSCAGSALTLHQICSHHDISKFWAFGCWDSFWSNLPSLCQLNKPIFCAIGTLALLGYQNMAEDHTCKGVGECHPYREFEGMQPSR